MTKLADREDIPVLEGGWINFTEAADRLGYTRSYMYKKADKGGFKTLRRIGTQPTFVINESEVDDLIAKQQAARAKAEAVEVEATPAEELEKELDMSDILSQIK